jgi:hypothetical protein
MTQSVKILKTFLSDVKTGRKTIAYTRMQLIKSPKAGKKWRAVFKDGTHTDFGSAGMDDYTLTHDKEQRERYRSRHRKDLDTNDPKRAGYLSWYLLWGESTSLETNLRAYKKRFNV